MRMLDTTIKLLDPKTKNLISVRCEPRTQQIENENPHAAFSCSQLLSHLRTLMMT